MSARVRIALSVGLAFTTVGCIDRGNASDNGDDQAGEGDAGSGDADAGSGDDQAGEGDEQAGDADDQGDDGAEPDGGDTPPDAECEAPNADVSAGFSVDLADLPAELDDAWGGAYTILDQACTVQSVASAGSVVTTTLGCAGSGDVVHTPSFEISLAEGDVADWTDGDSVLWSASYRQDTELGSGVYRSMRLFSADGDLLALAVDNENLPVSGPLTIEPDDGFCGGSLGDDEGIFALNFAIDGATESVVSGHRGLLEAPAAPYRIELETAQFGPCCHNVKWHRLIVARIADPA
ncbi:MAG: hypothetical protein AAF721_00155 [Myxococcota bacterium]